MPTRGEQMQADVLAILQGQDRPQSAYNVLAALRPAHPKIAPPTVYRALAALIERGQAHRVESLNAYMACAGDGHDHASIMSICDDCGWVEENTAPELLNQLSTVAGRSGFQSKRHIVEVHGVCAACSDRASEE